MTARTLIRIAREVRRARLTWVRKTDKSRETKQRISRSAFARISAVRGSHLMTTPVRSDIAVRSHERWRNLTKLADRLTKPVGISRRVSDGDRRHRHRYLPKMIVYGEASAMVGIAPPYTLFVTQLRRSVLAGAGRRPFRAVSAMRRFTILARRWSTCRARTAGAVVTGVTWERCVLLPTVLGCRRAGIAGQTPPRMRPSRSA